MVDCHPARFLCPDEFAQRSASDREKCKARVAFAYTGSGDSGAALAQLLDHVRMIRINADITRDLQ